MWGWLVFLVPEIQNYSKWIETVGSVQLCIIVYLQPEASICYEILNSVTLSRSWKVLCQWWRGRNFYIGRREGIDHFPKPFSDYFATNTTFTTSGPFYKTFIRLHIFHCVNYELICLVLNDSHSHPHRVNYFSHIFIVYISKRNKICLTSPSTYQSLGAGTGKMTISPLRFALLNIIFISVSVLLL